jgi:uncharacterized membrane protein
MSRGVFLRAAICQPCVYLLHTPEVLSAPRAAFEEFYEMSTDAVLLSGVEIFQLLDEEARHELAQVVERVSLPPEKVLFHFGEPGDALYLVRSGAVELFVKDNTGNKITLTVAKEGDIFGELALLDDGPRTATAQALEPSELFRLDRDDLKLAFQKSPDLALHLMAGMTRMTRQADKLLKTGTARDVDEEVMEKLSPLQRIADVLAWFSGSMPFLLLHAAWFVIWISLNTLILGDQSFDPFPFGLLTMIVSLEAIFLSCFVLISANRQAEKDKVRDDIEYETNIKAEMEISHLHEKTDQIYEDMMARFAKLEKLLAEK